MVIFKYPTCHDCPDEGFTDPSKTIGLSNDLAWRVCDKHWQDVTGLPLPLPEYPGIEDRFKRYIENLKTLTNGSRY